MYAGKRAEERVLADLADAWAPVLTLDLELVGHETNPQLARLLARQILPGDQRFETVAQGHGASCRWSASSACPAAASATPARARKLASNAGPSGVAIDSG